MINRSGLNLYQLYVKIRTNEPKYCFLNPGTMFVGGRLRELDRGMPLDAETYVTAFGDPPRRWPENHLQYLFDKISGVELLTREDLYDIFLPKELLNSSSTSEIEHTLHFLDVGEE